MMPRMPLLTAMTEMVFSGGGCGGAAGDDDFADENAVPDDYRGNDYGDDDDGDGMRNMTIHEKRRVQT